MASLGASDLWGRRRRRLSGGGGRRSFGRPTVRRPQRSRVIETDGEGSRVIGPDGEDREVVEEGR